MPPILPQKILLMFNMMIIMETIRITVMRIMLMIPLPARASPPIMGDSYSKAGGYKEPTT